MDKELTNEETRNWVKVCLAFRCVTECFNQFLKTKSEEQYNDNITCLTIQLGLADYKCSTCNLKTIRNKLCPEKTCEKLYDLIKSEHVKNPTWSNSKSELWSDKQSGPWERMKCFIETPGYTNKSDILQADMTAFVQICSNNVHLKQEFGGDLKYLHKIQSIRNEVSHLRSMKINTISFKGYILDIKNALQLQHFDQYRLADQLKYLESLENDMQRITVEDEIGAKEETLVVVKDLIASLKEQLEQTQSLNDANSKAMNEDIKEELGQLTVMQNKLVQQIDERFDQIKQHLNDLQKEFSDTKEKLSKREAKLEIIKGTLKLHSAELCNISMGVARVEKILEKNAGNNEVLERVEWKLDDIRSKLAVNVKQIDVPDMKVIVEIKTSIGEEQAGELLVGATNGIGRDGVLSDLQKHLQTALNNFCKDGVRIKYVKNECMAIYCGYPNMKCWLAFLHQYLNRKFDEVFLPVQNHLRTYIGYEDLELIVVIYEEDFKKSVQSIFYQLDAHLMDAVMCTEKNQLDKTSLNRFQEDYDDVAINQTRTEVLTPDEEYQELPGMDANTNLFTDKETNTWFKAYIALNVAKQGLYNFLDTKLQNVHAVVGRSCGNCPIEKLLPCPTNPYCKKRTSSFCPFHKTQKPRQCPLCDIVKQNIIVQHRYRGPSWKNTRAEKWAQDYWEIGKCFLPPDGYSSVSSVQETDFNGVISIMLNWKYFQKYLSSSCLSPPPPDNKCLLEKVRQIGLDIRHTSDCKVTDGDLQDYFRTLSTLLADPICLQSDPSAIIACTRLSDLQNDRMSVEELGELLKEAYQTVKHAQEEGECISEEATRKLTKAMQTLDATILFGEQCLKKKIQFGERRLKIETEVGEQRIKTTTHVGEQHLEIETHAGEQRPKSEAEVGEQ